MRKIALTGDELATLRGAGVVIPKGKHRNLRVLTHPRHVSQDRSVTVTRNGMRYRVNAKLRPIGGTITTREAPRKRTQFAIGATYGESWQTKNTDNSVTGEAREYWFRGVRYESQQAIEAFIASLG